MYTYIYIYISSRLEALFEWALAEHIGGCCLLAADGEWQYIDAIHEQALVSL